MSPAQRQAKRREQFRRMKDALERILEVTTAKEAREIAREALSGESP